MSKISGVMWNNDSMEITLDEIGKLEEDVCYVDIRNEIAYAHGHIPDAIHLEELSGDAALWRLADDLRTQDKTLEGRYMLHEIWLF